MGFKQVAKIYGIVIAGILGSVLPMHANPQAQPSFQPLTQLHPACKTIILIQRSSDTRSAPLQAHLIINLEHPHMQRITSKYSLQQIQDVRTGAKRTHVVTKKDGNNAVEETHTWTLAQHINTQELGITGDDNALKSVILQAFGHQGLVSVIKSPHIFDTVLHALAFFTILVQADNVALSYKSPYIVLSNDVPSALFLEEARKRIPEAYAKQAEKIDQKYPQGWKRSLHQLVIAPVRKMGVQQQAQSALNIIHEAEKILQAGKIPIFGMLRQKNDQE
jgi:hypothetical protein